MNVEKIQQISFRGLQSVKYSWMMKLATWVNSSVAFWSETGTYNVGCYTMLQPSTTFVGSKAVSQKSQPTLLLPKMLSPALPYNICWSNVVHLLFHVVLTHVWVEELKKKQATLQKDRPDLRIYFNRPPVPSSHSGGGGKRRWVWFNF